MLPDIFTHYSQFGIGFDPIDKILTGWTELSVKVGGVIVSLRTCPTLLRRTIETSHFDDDDQSFLDAYPTLFEYILQYGNFEQIDWVLSSLSHSQVNEVHRYPLQLYHSTTTLCNQV